MRRRRSEPYRWERLATYNAEVYRGIVHTPEYAERMRLEQIMFDAEQRARGNFLNAGDGDADS